MYTPFLESFFWNWTSWIYLFWFITINIWIVTSDLSSKRIPNKLLFILLIFLIFHFFLHFWAWNPLHLDWIFWVLMTFMVWFGIYFLHGWAPGDAKYFMVLSLFLVSSIDMIRFIGNISTISVVWILSMAIWNLVSEKKGKNNFTVKSEDGPKRKGKMKQDWLDILFFTIVLIWLFFSTIFLREWLYGESVTFHSLGIDAALILFLWLLLIRLGHKWLSSKGKEAAKKKWVLIFLSLIPIFYGILYKWSTLWYYLRDILLYGVPTMLLASLSMKYGLKLIRRQERTLKNFKDLTHTEVPLFILIKWKMMKVRDRDDAEKICRERWQIPEDAQVIIGKSSPFGHYIFVSFLLTAYTPTHLAYSFLREWFGFLQSFWEFLRQWL